MHTELFSIVASMRGLRALMSFMMLFISTQVDSFTFPGDWHKIRQLMDKRERKEEVWEQPCFTILFFS